MRSFWIAFGAIAFPLVMPTRCSGCDGNDPPEPVADVCEGESLTEAQRYDGDGDGIPFICDLCPRVYDPEQLDSDGDGVGDACAGVDSADLADADGDGTPDSEDRCPGYSDHWDADRDGMPDGCDQCPGEVDDGDSDGDGVRDCKDVCEGPDELCPGSSNRCGDGRVRIPEQCDDGNRNNADACLATCRLNVCGDGFVNALPGGEQCDDGNNDNTDACQNDCTFPPAGPPPNPPGGGDPCDPLAFDANACAELLCEDVCANFEEECGTAAVRATCIDDCEGDVVPALGICQDQVEDLSDCCSSKELTPAMCAAKGGGALGHEDCDDADMCPDEADDLHACISP